MKDLFPSDVSVRLRGDRAIAQTHLGAVRRMVFNALNIGLNPFALVQFFEDGSTAHLLISGKQKIVTIISPPPVEVELLPEEVLAETLPRRPRPSVMLSGWMRQAYHDYRPSPANQVAYDFEDKWQIVPKLLPYQGQIPSAYSGLMKRVVQAVQGLGWHVDESPDYITGDVTTGARFAEVTYSHGTSACTGIYKAGVKNHWVVRISRDNGVHAMPLITLPGTRTVGFRNRMINIGDTDSVKVLDEFGGIPSGRDIPGGAELATAIAEGRVLELMAPEDLEPFYGNLVDGFKSPWGNGSWAFAETTGHIVNTCFYQTAAIYAQPFYALGPSMGLELFHAPPSLGLTFFRRFLFSEWWEMRLSLTMHDITLPDDDPPSPCGSGTLTMAMMHRGKFMMPCFELTHVPSTGSSLSAYAPGLSLGGTAYDWTDTPYMFGWGPRPNADFLHANYDNSDWGATIYAFYDGDRLMRLKWVPPANAGNNGAYNCFIADGLPDRRHLSTTVSPILPNDAREAYLLSCRTAGAAGGAGVLLGYFAGVGPMQLDARNNGSMLGLLRQGVELAYNATVSGRGTQYLIDSTWYALNADDPLAPAAGYPELPTITQDLPTGTEDIRPGDMTWVGAPD